MRNRLMGRNDSTKRDVPTLNTSALPDLIFTVLFFFMIVTHMRDVDLKVHYSVPQGSEVQKLDHKGSIVHIFVGKTAGSDDYAIQLNNDIATLDDIRDFIAAERLRMGSDDQERLTVSIKADRDVPMGIIADIKKELQKAFALRINYSATEDKHSDKQ